MSIFGRNEFGIHRLIIRQKGHDFPTRGQGAKTRQLSEFRSDFMDFTQRGRS